MHIQYFYVMEQVKKKAIHVSHCLTEEMGADFFSKLLQGSLFTKIHEYIMGNEEPTYHVLPRSVLGNLNLASIRKHLLGLGSTIRKQWKKQNRNTGSKIRMVQGMVISWRMSRKQQFKQLVVLTSARNNLMLREYNVAMEVGLLNRDPIGTCW